MQTTENFTPVLEIPSATNQKRVSRQYQTLHLPITLLSPTSQGFLKSTQSSDLLQVQYYRLVGEPDLMPLSCACFRLRSVIGGKRTTLAASEQFNAKRDRPSTGSHRRLLRLPGRCWLWTKGPG